MVLSTVTPAPEKVTRQVSLVPWSWGRGVRVSTEEFVVLELKEVRASDIQEKVGGVPCSQAQGTEQVRLLGWPAFRVPGIMMSGVRDRAKRGREGERDGERGRGKGRDRQTGDKPYPEHRTYPVTFKEAMMPTFPPAASVQP